MSTAVAVDDFTVHLDIFEGPFDLLLQLIGKHQLDVTDIALASVTDEFLAHIRARQQTWDLGQATSFLVVAATLLDLKTSRLLPGSEEPEEEDLALLEARDLLFARLLQYRAYKQVAALMMVLLDAASKFHPRDVALEPRFAAVLPEVVLGIDADGLARLAARAMTPRPLPEVATDHVHAARVSVREHAALMVERLRSQGAASFRALCSDCTSTLEVVARFLALLELYREGAVLFEQLEALGELRVRWSARPGQRIGIAEGTEGETYEGDADPAADSVDDAEALADA